MNPFAPGSGLKPPALEGRESEIEAFDRLIVRTKRQAAERGMLLSGLRGVGKTVLLNNFAAQAERHDWFVVQIEAQPTPDGRKATRHKLARASKLYTYTGVSGLSRSTLAVECGTLVSVVPGSGVAALGLLGDWGNE